MTNSLPTHADVVIVGGGIVGCSIAYHLTRLGITDVVLLEQNKLTSGTTWHAAGLVGQLRATQNLTRLAKYTTELFAQLEAETGLSTGYKKTGSISLATNLARMEELNRQASTARAFGVEVEVIQPSDVLEYWPGINLEGVTGAVYLPGDGQTNPVDTTMALAKGARSGGAMICEDQEVLELLTNASGIYGVRTREGEIRANKVVLASGMWSRQLAAKIGVSIPLQAAEHFYIVTEPMPSLRSGMPTLRVPDEQAYFKEDAGKLLLGAFELEAKPWSIDGVPSDFAFGTLPDDMDHFAPIMEAAIKRFPALEHAGIQLWFNGPESFTPDDRYLLGPTAEYSNLFVAAGFNSIGIQSSGGAGKVLAEWIANDHPPMDLFDVDIKRMFPFQSTRKYLVNRTRESLGLLYAMHWPFRQYETARDARRGPLHQQMLDQGAAMGEFCGWERPNWFVRGNDAPRYEYSFGRQNWFDACKQECLAIRDSVVLFDQSSYPIFSLKGRDAATVLNHICANNVDVANGKVVYTQWLNERGGIEADVTVTRVNQNEFMIVSSCASEIRDFNWLESHIPDDAHAIAFNVSNSYAIIGVMGPSSRDVLSGLTPNDISDAALPFYSSMKIELGYSRIRINRLSYVGELGYELMVPMDFVAHVYEELLRVGHDYGLAHAGFHAMNACRVEKGYKHFGHDIGDEINPFQSGLGFAVDMSKPDFIGKSSLVGKQKDYQNRLVNIAVDDKDAPLLLHDEPIYCDNELVGITTSGMWGHRVERSLGIAMLSNADGVSRGYIESHDFQIEVAGKRYPLDVQLAPFYDPGSARMKR